MAGEVDVSEYERLMERAAACQAELEAIEQGFSALVARWMAGTPEVQAMAKRTLEAWLQADRDTFPAATQQRQVVDQWLASR